MFDLTLNAIANLYTKAVDHEIFLAKEATKEGDYGVTAAHMVKAIELMDYRDHEVLGQPYNDVYENL